MSKADCRIHVKHNNEHREQYIHKIVIRHAVSNAAIVPTYPLPTAPALFNPGKSVVPLFPQRGFFL